MYMIAANIKYQYVLKFQDCDKDCGDMAQKVVFDIDDTLWSLNKRIALRTGIDYNKMTIFSVHDNQNLTSEEKNLLLSSYADSSIFENIEWDKGIELINELNADVYINSNNLTQEIAEIKSQQIHEILNIPDDHITMNICNKKSDTTSKIIDDDTYIFIDDSPHNIEMSNAKFNIMIRRPWNEHYLQSGIKSVIYADDLYDVLRHIKSILL